MNIELPVALFATSFFVCLIFLYSQSVDNLIPGNDITRLRTPRDFVTAEVSTQRKSLRESNPSEKIEKVKPEKIQDEYATRMRLGIVRPRMLSWTPKVLLLDEFLTDEECDHIVSLARNSLEPSTVIDLETGKSVPDDWRNSSNYFLSEEEEKDPIVAPLLERISVFVHIPVPNAEPMQVLRYQNGQFYNAHEDYIYGPGSNGSPGRTITVLMYLTDGVVGGETWFPNATGTSSCGGEPVAGLSVQPKKRRAVVFWDMTWDGKSDEMALHAGCVVTSGEKWSATKWLLVGPWGEEAADEKSGEEGGESGAGGGSADGEEAQEEVEEAGGEGAVEEVKKEEVVEGGEGEEVVEGGEGEEGSGKDSAS